ncbi:MAG: hypothetical protein Q9191_004076 [Dirinaria sp. TL-2023a]
MSQDIKTVMIVGASGNLGRPIIESLSSNFSISVLSRKGSQATFPKNVSVYTISDTYPENELIQILQGQDAVISLLRSQYLEPIRALIGASVKAGVKRFIPGEFGSNSASSAARDAVPIFEKKWTINQLLVEKEREGLSWTGIICGAFFDYGLEFGFLGFDLDTSTATIYDEGNVKCQLTVLADIAQSVKGVLMSPAETRNRYVYINTFHLSQNEILRVLEGVQGKEWKRVRKDAGQSMRTGLRELEKAQKEGLPFDNELTEEVLRSAHWSEIEGMDYEE